MSLNLQVSIVFCTSVFWTRRQTGHTRQTGAQDSVENSLGRTRRTEANQRTEGEAALGAGEGDHLGRKKMKWGTFSSVKHGMIHGCWWSLIIQSSSFTFFCFYHQFWCLRSNFMQLFPRLLTRMAHPIGIVRGNLTLLDGSTLKETRLGKTSDTRIISPTKHFPGVLFRISRRRCRGSLGQKGPAWKTTRRGELWDERSDQRADGSRWVSLSFQMTNSEKDSWIAEAFLVVSHPILEVPECARDWWFLFAKSGQGQIWGF